MNEKTEQKKKNSSRFLKANDMIPSDDCFHGCRNFIDIEWWYFDAVFDNEYSIHIGFRVYHIKKRGLLQTRINLYHKGKSISEVIDRSFFTDNLINEKYPTISFGTSPTVLFDQSYYKKTKKYRYNIKLRIKHIQVNLVFEGTTEGWKIETPTTCWAVPLPKATVKGTLHINQNALDVRGIGYHDHNWGYSPVTVLQNVGWYWGRITADTLNLTWANTIESAEKSDILSVINSDKTTNTPSKYINVHPKYIDFSPKNFLKQNNKYLPTSFHLSFDQPATNILPKIAATIDMKTQDIQYSRIFIIHYWRYHVLTNGFIHYNDRREELIDRPQIIEYLSFKNPNAPLV